MRKSELRAWIVGVAACLLTAAAASAQDTGNVIGPPQLRDFQLQPKQRIVTQPDPNRPAAQVAPPPPATTAPDRSAPRRAPAPAAQVRRAPQDSAPDQAAPIQTAPVTTAPATDLGTAPTLAPLPSAPAALPDEAPAPAPAPGTPWWLYALFASALVLGGAWFLKRRRTGEAELAGIGAVPAITAPPAAPRPDPMPRPWLELELKTERASFTETEAVVSFELAISNTGKSPARDLRIDVKMFNAGREQDKEIGAFFRSAGRVSTKLNLPGIGPDSTGVIHGEVAMPLEDMRAVKLEGRTLFVPVVGVNALYHWGENRVGQSAKSYVIGRELQESPDKMGAFRVDQGPRIWRTVGQRAHSLAKRA